jgi:hypothetical protein
MKRPPSNVAHSVRTRLLTVSKAEGEEFKYVLIRYALERFPSLGPRRNPTARIDLRAARNSAADYEESTVAHRLFDMAEVGFAGSLCAEIEEPPRIVRSDTTMPVSARYSRARSSERTTPGALRDRQ